MISKNFVLYENYRDVMNLGELGEPIIKQYLETCPKNVTYASCIAVDSLK